MARFYLLLFYSGVVFRSFCICISSWHKDYLRGRKHKTKLNPCHSFCTNVSGLSSWGNYYWKNIAESAGKKARSCSPSKTGTRILHGEGRGRWGSVLCPLSPENREVTGWTVGAGLPQVSGCMFMAIGLPKTLLFGQSRQSSEQARTDAFAMLGSVLQIRVWQSSVTLHGWYFP